MYSGVDYEYEVKSFYALNYYLFYIDYDNAHIIYVSTDILIYLHSLYIILCRKTLYQIFRSCIIF